MISCLARTEYAACTGGTPLPLKKTRNDRRLQENFQQTADGRFLVNFLPAGVLVCGTGKEFAEQVFCFEDVDKGLRVGFSNQLE